MDTPDEVKIGLEIHCQLTALKTKLFCGCSADYRANEPNTSVCPVCLGLPGSLPVLNDRAVDLALLVALSIDCSIPEVALFFRKNYYYPDLPKNFQISQYDKAGGVTIAGKGKLTFSFDGQEKTVTIRRIQLEEDPGKVHYKGSMDTSPYALIDYNRSGVTLLEIVTEPEFTSPGEARIFLQKVRSILEHLEVSDGSLEGAMRCDANISASGGQRIEIKNISSFKEVERALNFEIIRQRNLLKKNATVKMETRHWDEVKRITISGRAKEEEQDYRYFPEPDLVQLRIVKEKITQLQNKMPELPDARKVRLIKEYKLSPYDAEILTSDRQLADFFEKCIAQYNKPKVIANWLMGDVLQILYSLDVELGKSKMTTQHLVEMVRMMDDGIISIKIAKKVLWEILKAGKSPVQIVEEQGWVRITDEKTLEETASKVFNEHSQAVQDALSDPKTAHYLVGQLMSLTHGRADPQLANKIVNNKLDQIRKARRLE
ncbi:MAG: Asp-tRNA(Asn)/Glu-tRNA(Gln) amidotransferase subunit GatB [Candidatus Bathyarchaeia archaeon]